MGTIHRFPRRAHAATDHDHPREPDLTNHRDLWVVGGLVWVASLVRVGVALVQHEVFGAEATLAAISVVALPWLMRGWQRGRRAS